MFECTYTKDKLKKAKIWLDGFITINNDMINLYNEDKKCIYRYKYKQLLPELILPSYIIYCEKIGLPAEDDDIEINVLNEKNENKQIESKHNEYKHNENKYRKMYKSNASEKFKKLNNEKEKITDSGIIQIDDGNEYQKIKTNTTNKKFVGRSEDEILEILNKINK